MRQTKPRMVYLGLSTKSALFSLCFQIEFLDQKPCLVNALVAQFDLSKMFLSYGTKLDSQKQQGNLFH